MRRNMVVRSGFASVSGRWVCAALGLALASCTDLDEADGLTDDDEVTARSGFKGFEEEFAAATQDALFIELFNSETGNVRITAEVPESFQDSDKKNFILRGPEDAPFVLRDDGEAGDEKAGDQVFTALAAVDLDELKSRDAQDKQSVQKDQVNTVPVFRGRVQVGEAPAELFDLEGFFAQKRVAFGPSKLFPWWLLVVPKSSLMVTAPGVVRDPTRTFDPCNGGTKGGDWTFGRLMTEMAGPNPPADFVEDWLDHWLTPQTVNGHTALARPNVQTRIIDKWRQASGGGALDLNLAPFRLLAIVNRVDLRGGGSSYGGGNAGEMRFVFGLVDTDTCQPRLMTVIFEYGVPRSGCKSVRDWGRAWWALQDMKLGSPAYNDALAALAEQVVVAGADPSKPNGSAINQVRTNEIALAAPWELREFRLGQPADPDELVQTTVALTPDDGFKPVILNAGNSLPATVSGSVPIDNYVSAHLGSLCPPIPVLPHHDFTGADAALLGASSLSQTDPDQPPPFAFVFWKLLGLDNVANTCERHTLSVNTCNGCHAGETDTRNFTHIDPGTFPLTAAANLSGFLTGITVPDPAVGFPSRTFNDLLRRAQDLRGLVSATCFKLPRLAVEVASLEEMSSLPPNEALFNKGGSLDVIVEDLAHEPPPVH